MADRCGLTAGNYCVGPPSIGDRGQVNYAGGSDQCLAKGGGKTLLYSSRSRFGVYDW